MNSLTSNLIALQLRKLFPIVLSVLLNPLASSAAESKLGPDSQVTDGVPQGSVIKKVWKSTIFPGTERDYWIYIPAQYNPDHPSCLMVFNDGRSYVSPSGSFRTPTVFDNLIHQKAMPVTIGVFLNPGVIPPVEEHQSGRRTRSFEYDSLGDRYARFVIGEIIPELSKNYSISKNPDCRAIGGISSGGIAAFTVAWERPDAFHKVLCHIGSFTNIRGGNSYPFIIRKTESKPLRIFLQEGIKIGRAHV